MRTFTAISVIFLMFFASTTFCVSAAEEESRAIKKIDLPEAVLNAFTKDFPEMAITGVEIWETDGKTYYEIESGEGETDVVYLADGTLYSVEQEIAVDDLPQEVTDALTAAYSDGEIEEAQKIIRGSDTEYEVVVVIEEEEEDLAYEIVITADGKIVSEEKILEADEEEVPDDIDIDDIEEGE